MFKQFYKDMEALRELVKKLPKPKVYFVEVDINGMTWYFLTSDNDSEFTSGLWQVAND